MPAPKILLLELNELNFELVERYVGQGELPNLGRLFRDHGYAATSSEARQEDVEPWIQWVSAHTGRTLDQHGIRRLGDIVATDFEQIWERLEAQGLRVGAFSPMNAKHRLKAPAFFVPDPWTETEISAPPLVRAVYRAIRQAVGDNAEGRVAPSSLLALLAGALAYVPVRKYPLYVRNAWGAWNRPWRRAVVLDLLMGDMFATLCRRGRVDFASLFLNAAAHIQHHYLNSSGVVEAVARNPDWYCEAGCDPVLEVYRAYDAIVGDLARRFPAYRLLLATGLTQVTHDAPTYYWRLKDHAGFLAKLGVEGARVAPLMSRDFLLEFASAAAAAAAEQRLMLARGPEGGAFFEVDNRGDSLFVTLSHATDIAPDAGLVIGNAVIADLREQVTFVAIKNGEHDGRGFLLDTAAGRAGADETPITEVHSRIVTAFA